MGCFSKKDIVNTICAKRALKRDDVSVIVNDVFSSITDALARNDEVKLRGFGTFTMKRKAALKKRMASVQIWDVTGAPATC